MPHSLAITLEDLGYEEFFGAHIPTSESDTVIARVIAEHKESYTVKSIHGEYSAKVTGKHVFTASKRADFPAVGDFVIIEILDSLLTLLDPFDFLPMKWGHSNSSLNCNTLRIPYMVFPSLESFAIF